MYGWNDCPETVRDQVERFLSVLREILSDNLVGVYLHGSLAMGCFNPKRSDIDLLAITRRGMSVEEKRRIAELLLNISGSPYPIEVSFLSERDLNPWEHPTPFDLHYSEMWRRQYEEDLSSGRWRDWNEERHKDEDLAAHITVILNRGISLYGPSPRVVFPSIPEKDYIASILSDFEWARDRIIEDPVYGVLNLCRVYRYLLEGRISSKEEIGVWALRSLPGEFHGIIAQALEIYRGKDEDTPFDKTTLEKFATYMGESVKTLLRSGGR
jgi:streptomycin 3"-adenylyltransferase